LFAKHFGFTKIGHGIMSMSLNQTRLLLCY